jgi:hypothetical protein
MKISKKMTIGEFAAFVASQLESKGISTVLTGGAVVSIYTENKYMSYDADFISPTDHKIISSVMQEMGFEKHGKDFKHKDTDFFVEFPSGPLAIGDELVKAESRLEFNGNKLKLLSPTQCVMDRLSAYFHWNDLQCLDQAIWVAEKQPIQLSKIREWAKREGEEDKFKIFFNRLKK